MWGTASCHHISLLWLEVQNKCEGWWCQDSTITDGPPLWVQGGKPGPG